MKISSEIHRQELKQEYLWEKKSENPFECERVLFFIFALHKIFLKNEITFTHTTQTYDILPV